MQPICRLVPIVALISACGKPPRPSDTGTSVSASVDSQPRLVATAVVHGGNTPSVPRPSGRPLPVGLEYERAVQAALLPDVRDATPVRPPTSDETDLSNYQAAGWRIGVDPDDVGRIPVRFFANYSRGTSGVVTITLDTTLTGRRLEPPFDSNVGDSVAIAGLRRQERVAIECRFGAYDRDERIIGVLRNDTREQWMPARIAWLLDTARVRIRAIRPMGITCIRDENPD